MRPADQRLEAGASRRSRDRPAAGSAPRSASACSAARRSISSAPARLHAGIHLRLEEAERALALGLGAIERHVGVLQQPVGIVAVAGRQRDADAGADRDRVPVDDIGLADDREQARASRRLTSSGRLDIGLQDGELVAAQPGDVSSSRSNSARRRSATPCSSVSPNGWPSVSLTALEVVEIDAQHGEACAPLRRRRADHLLHALPQQNAVRQRGQRVVMRHEGDPRLGALALGDVDGGDQHRRPAVVGQLPQEDRHVDHRAVGLAMLPGARRHARPATGGDQAELGPRQPGHGCRAVVMRQELARGRSRSARPRRR